MGLTVSEYLRMLRFSLQGEDMKRNLEMDKSAVWASTGCKAVSPISGLRFMSSPCTVYAFPAANKMQDMYVGQTSHAWISAVLFSHIPGQAFICPSVSALSRRIVNSIFKKVPC